MSEENGVLRRIDVHSYADFTQILRETPLLGNEYVFRGQGCDLWELRPSLNRLLRESDAGSFPQEAWNLTKQHLERFKTCVERKEYIVQDIDLKALSREEWWLLGQHYGLPTPVLDWTECPFIAAFFAFQWHPGETKEEDPCLRAWEEEPWRCVWAARKCSINARFPDYEDVRKAFNTIHFFKTQRFQRVRNQRGLFSLGPALDCFERAVQINFKATEEPVLVKIRIKDTPDFPKALEKNGVNDQHLLSSTENKDLEKVTQDCKDALECALGRTRG